MEILEPPFLNTYNKLIDIDMTKIVNNVFTKFIFP